MSASIKLRGYCKIWLEKWDDVNKIEYIELLNEADMICHEIYYINLWKPKYNKAEMGEGYPTMKPTENNWKICTEKVTRDTSSEITLFSNSSVLKKNLF